MSETKGEYSKGFDVGYAAGRAELLAEVVPTVKFYADRKTVNAMINGTGDDFYQDESGNWHGGKRARALLAKLNAEGSK